MAIRAAVFQPLELLVGGDAAFAVSALDELGEGELLALSLGDIVVLDAGLHFIKELPRNEWLVLALIPVAASFRVLEFAVVEGVADEDVEISEREALAGMGLEPDLKEPSIRLPPAPPCVADLLEDLPYRG